VWGITCCRQRAGEDFAFNRRFDADGLPCEIDSYLSRCIDGLHSLGHATGAAAATHPLDIELSHLKILEGE